MEIIGEASKNISSDLKKLNPEIPWKNAAGLRDRLIHHYFVVDWVIVWDVICKELPPMKFQIEKLA